MVLLRTVQRPGTVMSYEKVDDTSPSALAMCKVKVQVFNKGEWVVRAQEIYPFPRQPITTAKSPRAGRRQC